MRIRYLLCAVVIAVLITGQAAAFDLTLLHVNDSHSYLDATGKTLTPEGKKTSAQLGAWARLTTAVDDVRAEKGNVALLHAGDAVQGGLYFMKYNGRPEMEFLNRLDFDAFTLGNHEFDKGPAFLEKFLRYTDVPVLGANINIPEKSRLAAHINPYTILEYGSDRVGVVGLTTSETAIISVPGKSISFADEEETARKYVKELQAQGIDKIILLTHVGLARDMKLAARIPGVDVIVGGHSHTLLGDQTAMKDIGVHAKGPYPVVVKGADGNDVYVVQAWKWARVLGRLNLTFDDKGMVTQAKGSPVLLVGDTFRRTGKSGGKVVLEGTSRKAIIKAINDSPVAEVVPLNTAAEKFLTPYSKGVEKMHKEIIGIAMEPLYHIRVPGVTESGEKLPEGSLLAPIVCKAMLNKLATTGKPAQIALQNAGGVRKFMDAGNITVGTVYTILPFNNTLVLLTLTGAQIRQALENGVTRGDGAFPYVSGARYTADMTKPEGERVTVMEIRKDRKWEPLEADATYTLVTNAFLANGGDGYAVLKDAATRHDTGFVEAASLAEYVKRIQYLKPFDSTGVTYIPAQ